jgi:hypothetical protein
MEVKEVTKPSSWLSNFRKIERLRCEGLVWDVNCPYDPANDKTEMYIEKEKKDNAAQILL